MKRPNPLPPDQMTAASVAPNCAPCSLSGWSGCCSASEANLLTELEKFAYTIRPTDAVMHPEPNGDRMTTHDPIPARLAALKTTRHQT